MNSDEKFWIAIWALAAIVCLAICSSVTAYSINKNNAIAASKDPIATACAMGRGDEPLCIQKGAKP